MKVLFLLLGPRSQASSRARGYWVTEELQALGVQCKTVAGFSFSSFVKCVGLIPFFDCLFLQKRYTKWDYFLLKFSAKLGKKTVIDLDDKYSKVDNKITLQNLVRIMKSASAVTVGCRALLNFVLPFQPRTYYLPTSLKLANYRPVALNRSREGDRDHVVLGWIGNGRHYHEDLINTLEEPLRQAAALNKVTLKLVGVCKQQDLHDAFESIPGLKTEFIDSLNWADESEIVQAMSDFDVGLYPLEDNDFNGYKCGFKALEYMAMGIPVISSPVGANCYIINEGIDGLLADNAHTWTRAICTLVQNRDLRIRMGEAGRRKVELKYDVKFRASELVKILRAKD